MKDAALVFATQYVYVLLLGLQSLNVNQKRYVSAAIVSFLLGIGGFFVTSMIGSAKNMALTSLWWGFVLSGPFGIVSAMHLQPHLVRWTTRKT